MLKSLDNDTIAGLTLDSGEATIAGDLLPIPMAGHSPEGERLRRWPLSIMLTTLRSRN